MELLIILSLLWRFWFANYRRHRRRWFVLPIAGVTAILFCISPLGIGIGQWGLMSLIPPDSGDVADAIVVLGRGSDLRDSRIAEAWELWKSKRAPQIFASGMLDAKRTIQTLENLGVQEQYLSGEECSQSTQENALFSSALLRSQGVKKILLVTDPPHMLRSLLTFQSFGFQVIPHPSPLPAQYTSQNQMTAVLREYAGLAGYTLTGQFSPRTEDILNNPPVEITQRIADWGCHVRGKNVLRP
jgi:uncharacterized SAM-binding protein YcdF (DUF218 family)